MLAHHAILPPMGNTESKARAGIRKLRTEVDLEKFPEIAGVADSLESLLDGASKGGTARAKSLSKKRRKEIATKASRARWAKGVS